MTDQDRADNGSHNIRRGDRGAGHAHTYSASTGNARNLAVALALIVGFMVLELRAAWGLRDRFDTDHFTFQSELAEHPQYEVGAH